MKIIFLILLVICSVFATQHSSDGLCEGGWHAGVGTNPDIHYYYDKDVENCVQFVYFGSGGNKNRHETREKCQRACNVPVGKKVFRT